MIFNDLQCLHYVILRKFKCPNERKIIYRHKKGVRFENVKIYLFERTQGFDVVPSSGGFALGMQKKHFDIREIALHSKMANDNITKSQDNKLPTKNLVEQVYTVSARRKRKCCNALDENSVVTKQLRINGGSVDQTKATTNDYKLLKAKAIANKDNEESGTSERTSSNMPKCVPGYNAEEEGEKDNIYMVKKYFRPLSRRIRLLKLRRAGFKKFVKDDQMICNVIRESRKHCGCSCGTLPCSPETCECSRNGIECLVRVDRPSFPCACTAASCNNPFGRREFDETLVYAHFRSTLMRTQAVQKLMHTQATHYS
uniref:CSRNP_N domain-containing protein n=1 Tax=Wuchereria bancrofti TaxID=6293 RepID=A0A1I8EA13_WUCBA